MSTDADKGAADPVTPDEAFAALGNETRTRILQALGEVGEPLSFTELRGRVGFKQGGQFNYHLDKLVDHFVEKTDGGYALRGPGRRVVQAILSGAVTEAPVVESTPVTGWSCPYCGGRVSVRYRDEEVARFCTDCAGFRGTNVPPSHREASDETGYLGRLSLPPAGVTGRTAEAMLQAAFTWGYADWLVAANGVCPRCSASVDRSVAVCETHDAADGFCTTCGERHAVRARIRCSNCTFDAGSIASMALAGTTELLAFATAHGLNPFTDPWDWGWEYGEEVVSIDPFRARFTFEIDGDSLALTVDDDLRVVEADR